MPNVHARSATTGFMLVCFYLTDLAAQIFGTDVGRLPHINGVCLKNRYRSQSGNYQKNRHLNDTILFDNKNNLFLQNIE